VKEKIRSLLSLEALPAVLVRRRSVTGTAEEKWLLFGFETLSTAPATHDGSHEGEESVTILVRLNGTDFVLQK
jgi:hypothetical protein